MPRRCTVCQHPDRDEIDARLIGGQPLRNIAKQFGVSATALYRHKTGHLPGHLKQAKETSERLSAERLLADLERLQERILRILERAEERGDLRVALTACRELRETVMSTAELLEATEIAEKIESIEEIVRRLRDEQL